MALQIRSKSLREGEDRKTSHESTVRDALWDMSDISTAQLKTNRDRRKNRDVKPSSRLKCTTSAVISDTNGVNPPLFSSPHVKKKKVNGVSVPSPSLRCRHHPVKTEQAHPIHNNRTDMYKLPLRTPPLEKLQEMAYDTFQPGYHKENLPLQNQQGGTDPDPALTSFIKTTRRL